RPSQADPRIKTPIGLPNHPSYPSAHSCFTAAYLTVVAATYPDTKERLEGMVTEAGLSRMYAGIHFRFDLEAGKEIGRKVAEYAIQVAPTALTSIHTN
ncbi:MAG TPA: phosphatase PAP2 family protein, partial [Gemmatimonadaceae bacterium]|nr:phosphatase PAP2 family protein [Gemmatimonadaceae bacterium]